MRVVIASDSFKGSATSLAVADAVERGIHRSDPFVECLKFAVADGGEGLVKALRKKGDQIVTLSVRGPLGTPVSAQYIVRGTMAIMEMAEASGLPLVAEGERNPLLTTTYGTGEMMLDALDRGCTEILLGIGGSATNDCGVGMAAALGVRFLAADGREVAPCGGELSKISRIDSTGLSEKVRTATIRVACDVDNPLCGPQGASAIYGPQKGATPEMVGLLDDALSHVAEIVETANERRCGMLRDVPGAGAAGGLGFGLMAFCGANLVSGIELVLDVIGIDKALKNADLVITGEGRIDGQSKRGKVPVGIAARAKRYGVPAVVLAGDIGPGVEKLYELGLDSILSTTSRAMPLSEAMSHSLELTEDAADRMWRLLVVGMSMGMAISSSKAP